MSKKPAVLVTGASTGIGAVYAERFARRGHNLVLVARNAERLDALAARLRDETGVHVDVVPADLTNDQDLARIEQRLSEDDHIGVLINNAGTSIPRGFLQQKGEDISKLIALNVTAVTRLAHAAAPRFAESGEGAIINVASVVGLAPEMGATVYGATKAFVLFLSQGLNVELAAKGVYVQAVLPAATRTEIWDHAGVDVNTIAGVMEVGDLVDAALVGFDRRELVTIPPLPDGAQWTSFDTARQAMLPNFAQSEPADRYRSAA
ncbi:MULTISPECIES: SDR family oxidoreductase [unclassified Ensifer]|uniref:SDR family NAD(P)-dependent oxidoreductase n=1 Tax=unclassified Ensifer TaxID=2633371 RepID=UPI000813488E|nr:MULTISPECIES: SDR family oxidoreductase [unclassified Ensifer]OCP02459.1 SDR family oxidoreductase [Ensifer sp. LC14]OCP05291.1 SDR family oxidoreductase [Ensifer sp. LC13]OCP14733.1 SDR family oxidoreductase [Ensifer sp. LC11]OCP30583.1 SDR family oxidoreductase [Ensifer sp. LC499]